jgi:F-type H+-transporting ATPase subunit a
MTLSPDENIFWQYGFISINATIVWTWVIMLFLVIVALLIKRKLRSDIHISRWQCLLEMLVKGINQQIEEVGLNPPIKYIGFIGTLFLFIATSNLCIIFPGYEPPTGSLSTTVALSLSVFFAVPIFGILECGVVGYLKSYLHPTFFMLPFHIISEISRTIALSVRLFGNIMSGSMIVAILLSIVPFVFPMIMNVLGLLTGLVQAYIFSILATVYIASGMTVSKKRKLNIQEPINKKED